MFQSRIELTLLDNCQGMFQSRIGLFDAMLTNQTKNHNLTQVKRMTSKRQRISPSMAESIDEKRWECIPSLAGPVCLPWNGTETKNPTFESIDECQASRCYSRAKRLLGSRDVLQHLGPFMDTSSLASVSDMDPYASSALSNQLALAVDSDKIRDEFFSSIPLDYRGPGPWWDLFETTLAHPESKRDEIVAVTALRKIVRDIADSYRLDQPIDIPSTSMFNLLYSVFLMRTIKDKFPEMFDDFVKGLMGPKAYVLERTASLIGDAIVDPIWFGYLEGEGLDQILVSWFGTIDPKIEGIEHKEHFSDIGLTVRLLKALPSDADWGLAPFYAAERMVTNDFVSAEVLEEFAKFLDQVNPPRIKGVFDQGMRNVVQQDVKMDQPARRKLFDAMERYAAARYLERYQL